MIEQRTTIRQRMDTARAIFAADHGYRSALMIHDYTVMTLKRLAKSTGLDAPCGSSVLMTGAVMLYEETYRMNNGCPPILIDADHGVSAHFLQFAADVLPRGPNGTPLRAMILKALRRWRRRHPGQSPEPNWRFPTARSTSSVGVGPGTGCSG